MPDQPSHPPKGRIALKLHNAVTRAIYLRRALYLIWTAAKSWTFFWAILLVIQGLLPAATVYLTKLLVDNLATAIGTGLSWVAIRPVLIPAAIMGSLLLLTQILNGVLGWIRAAQSELIQDHIKSLVHEKAGTVDLEFFETPEQSDKMTRANSEAATRSMSLLENMGGLLQNLLTLLAVAALLIPYSIWLPLILFLSTVPALWVVLHHNLFHYDWWEKTTEMRRWTHYFDGILTYSYPAAEVRLFGLTDHFRTAYTRLRRQLREGRLRLMRNQSIAQLGASVVALLVTVSALAWMGARALRGMATLGDIALFYQAFNQGQGLMRGLLSSVGQLYADAMFVEHLFTFLDLEPTIKSPDTPVPAPETLSEGIHFENVYFKYPGSEHLALDDFSLFIPAGKTVAIVGPNGAGKTTVTKLLCRFYDPTTGSIRLDGTDLRSLDLSHLRRLCTVLFQSPVRYIATVTENIAMGDRSKDPTKDRVAYAARGGSADEIVSQLPNGYETLLGKQFRGGVELSGGQWQRISLARAFYRESPIVILDEPTSLMDSWAESVWLDHFRELVKDRTAIIVTHRFTTAMRADVIHVMDEGKVVESGTHRELIDQNGLYARSWLSQMQAEYHPEAVRPDDRSDIMKVRST